MHSSRILGACLVFPRRRLQPSGGNPPQQSLLNHSPSSPNCLPKKRFNYGYSYPFSEFLATRFGILQLYSYYRHLFYPETMEGCQSERKVLISSRTIELAYLVKICLGHTMTAYEGSHGSNCRGRRQQVRCFCVVSHYISYCTIRDHRVGCFPDYGSCPRFLFIVYSSSYPSARQRHHSTTLDNDFSRILHIHARALSSFIITSVIFRRTPQINEKCASNSRIEARTYILMR